MADKVLLKQVKSTIGVPDKHIAVLKALGLGRIGKTKELPATDSVKGMIAKVAHLIEVK
jgi:large subunit ribosomal protein L30